MTEREAPKMAPATEKRREEERQRLAEALRQNLARRKDQRRGRDDAEAIDHQPSPDSKQDTLKHG